MAVLFQDGFEDDPSDWTLMTDAEDTYPYESLVNWDLISGIDGAEWLDGFGSTLRIGTGRNGGNALYCYKSSASVNGYATSLPPMYFETPQDGIYHRWYMKMPTPALFDKVCSLAGEVKMHRYILQEYGFEYTVPEILVSWNDGDPDGKLSQGYLECRTDYGVYLNLKLTSEMMDNQWHCHELYLRGDTFGGNNGVCKYWFDGGSGGNPTYSNEAVDWNFPEDSYDSGQRLLIHTFTNGLGNNSSEPWLQETPAAIAYDDIVVSTDYIGLDNSQSESTKKVWS